jgi:AsmA protein
MGAVGRWVLLALGALVALVLLAAGVLAFLVSRVDVRAEVERAVESATGRELTIAGDVGVSYWPVLGLHAAGASLANVQGGHAPALMTAEDIHVGVELGPLLNRQIVVRELVLQNPRIALEVDAEGKPNWILVPPPAPNPAPTPAPRPAPDRPRDPGLDVERTTLREVRITGGEVRFTDARRGAGWLVGDVNLTTSLTSLADPMRLTGRVRYNDRDLDLVAQVGRPGAALRGQPTPLKLDLKGELLEANFDGQTVAASGELAGAVRASGPSLRQLAAWTATPFQGGVGLERFAVTGRLVVGGGRYDFTNAGFAIDLIRGRGDFSLSEHRGKPYLSGRLQLFDFDLNPYLTGQAPAPEADDAPAPPTGAETLKSAPSAEIAAVEAPARSLDVQAAPGTTPISFAGLQAFNADLELITAAVLVQRMRVDSARLNLVINDGNLAATLHELTLYGGSGRGRFELDARGEAPRIVQELAFSNLDARRFLSDAINFSNIEGRAEVSFNLRTQGRTQTEMIEGADGGTHIEVVSGVLHGVDLGGVSRTIRNALRGELIAPEARTPFLGFSATFAIADGVLASDDLSFNTADLRIPGLGVIDLPPRRLDLRLAPRSARGGIVFPFSIRGPWTQFTYAWDGSDRALREVTARVRQVEAAARAGN